jgi:hypothetical protein
MTQSKEISGVMKNASSAVTRTVGWSSAKKEFAHRIISSSVVTRTASSEMRRSHPSSPRNAEANEK